MRATFFLCNLAFGVGVVSSSRAKIQWEEWLENFGHDAYQYPAWISAQRDLCECDVELGGPGQRRSVQCSAAGAAVDWRQASEIDYCVAKHWMLEHMPDFDLHYLPPSLSVDGESMLDDNIAFTLMALNMTALQPQPPLQIRLNYLLPYAAFHEARANWRPIFFAKYFAMAVGETTTKAMLTKLIHNNTAFMNWTGHYWKDSPRQAGQGSGSDYKVVWSSSTNPPVVAPFDMLAYGYGSCTAWATFLTSALKSIGVPARQAGTPCWNTGDYEGLATENANVSKCWVGGAGGAKTGGGFLNNHNWVEYWDNEAHGWSFLDVPPPGAPSESTWWCSDFSPSGGCSCGSHGGKAQLDHPVVAATWQLPGEADSDTGGAVLNISNLVLTNGEKATPLAWAPNFTSPMGRRLANVALRFVNRTDFYRCKSTVVAATMLA